MMRSLSSVRWRYPASFNVAMATCANEPLFGTATRSIDIS